MQVASLALPVCYSVQYGYAGVQFGLVWLYLCDDATPYRPHTYFWTSRCDTSISHYVSDRTWLERPAIVGGFPVSTSPFDGRPGNNAPDVGEAPDTGDTVSITFTYYHGL
jgi:hypothetical protein